MKHIHNIHQMKLGKYYLCYEVFGNRQKNVFIGKFSERADDQDLQLLGRDVIRDIPDDWWMIYERFCCVGGDVQEVFELTEEEIMKHIIMETI